MFWGKRIKIAAVSILPLIVNAQPTAKLQYQPKASFDFDLTPIVKMAKKFSFNYGMTYLGPSLSSRYQDGATYNRTNTGQDFQGTDTDPTGSTQIYHSMSLGFKVSNDIRISYSKTFQDDLNKNIEYEMYNKDGSVWGKGTRADGVSNNNERANIFVSGIYKNNYVYLSTNFFYEFPSTDISKNSNMNYGLGIQPALIIYSKIPGLFHGISASIERDYYKNQDYSFTCGQYEVGGQTYSTTCNTKYQTSRISISPYIGYYTSDKTFWKAQITYDWDQDGDEVNHIGFSSKRFGFDDKTKFNDNMDNILDIGPTYIYNNHFSAGLRLRLSINQPELERTAILGSFSLSI